MPAKVCHIGVCDEVEQRLAGDVRAVTVENAGAFGVDPKDAAFVIQFQIGNRRSFIKELILTLRENKRFRVLAQGGNCVDERVSIRLRERGSRVITVGLR